MAETMEQAAACLVAWQFKSPADRTLLHPGGGSKAFWGDDNPCSQAANFVGQLLSNDHVDWVTETPLYAPGTDPAIATLIAERDRALAALDAMRAERDAAAEDERDACAQIAEREGGWSNTHRQFGQANRGRNKAASNIAAAIRARASQEKPHGIPAGKEG